MESANREPEADEIPSPCVHDCRLDPVTDVCLGCRRTIDEIVGWRSMDSAGKRAAWERIARETDLRPRRDSA